MDPTERPATPRTSPSPSEGSAAIRDQHPRHRWAWRLLHAFLRLPGPFHVASLLSATCFVVDGDSMRPGLTSRQYLLVNRLAYRLITPSRGDIIVLSDPVQPGWRYIKRIVGLPGEHVHIETGQVFIDGHILDEPHVDIDAHPQTPYPNQWLLDYAEFFVLGDHRQNSRDSRSFGPIRRSHIIGKAWIRYWPPET